MAWDEEARVTLEDGSKIRACLGDRSVEAGMPGDSRDAAFPHPLGLFKAAVATSAGSAVLDFCRKRGVSPEGIEVTVSLGRGRGKERAEGMDLELRLPAAFPDALVEDLVHAAGECEVARLVTHPPAVSVRTKTKL